MSITSTAHAANFGLEIVADATISYSSNQDRIILPTNQVKLVIRPPVVRPDLKFYRATTEASASERVTPMQTLYSPSGSADGPFEVVDVPAGVAEGVNLTSDVPVVEAQSVQGEDLVFVRLDYLTGNLHSQKIDEIVITVTSDTGDFVTVKLFENGVDSGVFWGYVPVTQGASVPGDSVLKITPAGRVSAEFGAGGIAIEVAAAEIRVSAVNTVFNAVTGAPLDGAQIAVFDNATAAPANLYGLDGVSSFPSVFVSGSDVIDSAGTVYENAPGGFVIPWVKAGSYYIEVTPPDGYTSVSSFRPDQITSPPGRSFVLDREASYGGVFVVEQARNLQFDIPLDKQTQLKLTKSVDVTYADIGDFVDYTLTLENETQGVSVARVRDTLPLGFRYVAGSTRVNGDVVADPAIAQSGTELNFAAQGNASGRTLAITYKLEVGPGAFMGDAVNTAVAQTRTGFAISNVARAGITFREDLMRRHSTIVGRVATDACAEDESWARKINPGAGVAGVRLYMEDGAYTVSDGFGLYHFEGVSEGAHVVQVDKDTLPAGYAVMMCEENTRYAGSATSKFIDIQGGGIAKANFYLKRLEGEALAEDAEETAFSDLTEYLQFDKDWLSTQNATPGWVYPEPLRTPSQPSVNIGLKHGVDASIALSLNGVAVARENFVGRETDAKRTVMISRWKGIDILPGVNVFRAEFKDASGAVVSVIEEEIAFVKNIARVSAVANRSELVADGRSVPVIAVRLEDEAGRPVHAGRRAKIAVQAPYRVYDEDRRQEIKDQSSTPFESLGVAQAAYVGTDGVVEIKLQPTLKTGKVTVNVTLDNERIVPINMYLTPETRDWVVVGIADGSLGHETLTSKAVGFNGSETDIVRDGRVAFFAKGLIKGEWLLTLAVDTDAHTKNRNGAADGDFLTEIDPNAYYTLYGDQSFQDYEAQSRYPVFVKLEKRNAYALFGDFLTNIEEGKLTAYNRKLSGLKAEYVGERVQVLGFAAETNQRFAKDELAADGTSGVYQLSTAPILAQSETVIIETRDRVRSDIVLERRTLERFVDYTLDYFTGELIFNLPVDVSDGAFNPNVIIVDYETSEASERNITYGGRVELASKDGRVRIGSTAIVENGSAQARDTQSRLIGVDLRAQVSESTDVRLEYAVSDKSGSEAVSDAILAEIVHTSKGLNVLGYYREESADFGLGQSNSNTTSVRRYGADAQYQFKEFVSEADRRRGTQSVQTRIYREDNLNTGDRRDAAEFEVNHTTSTLSVGAGLRAAKDTVNTGGVPETQTRESVLAIANARYNIPQIGLTLVGGHEQPLGGQDAVGGLPARTTVGVDKTLGTSATLSLRHEVQNGADIQSENTSLGLAVTPWKGSVITAAGDSVTQDSTRRLAATVGLDQQIRLSETWSASGGLRHRRALSGDMDLVEVAPDAAVSVLERSEDFTSGYVGLGYRTPEMFASTRLEGRDSVAGQTWIGSASVGRELSETLSLAGALRATFKDSADGLSDSNQLDGRLGLSWRPKSDDIVVFNRLDLSSETTDLDGTRVKLVNNMSLVKTVANKWHLSAYHGIKYVREDLQGGGSVSSLNNLLGVDTRYDLSPKLDLGLRGSTLINDRGQMTYSFGPSVGVTPTKNMWISLGYNLSGFRDEDFYESEYARRGPFLQFRVKFDESTAEGLLRRLSPTSRK